MSEIAIRSLFEAPTVEALCDRLNGNQPNPSPLEVCFRCDLPATCRRCSASTPAVD
jgi:hypothetical protein